MIKPLAKEMPRHREGRGEGSRKVNALWIDKGVEYLNPTPLAQWVSFPLSGRPFADQKKSPAAGTGLSKLVRRTIENE